MSDNKISVPDVTYGFIGIGNMGFGMAQNVSAKIPSTSKLVIFDLNKTQVESFLSKAKGKVEVASSSKEVSEKADIIFTSLPHGNAVQIVFDELLSISKPSRPKLFLECSTIEIGTANKVRDQVINSGIGEYVDSPVSGGIASAAKGDLTIMMGGTTELYERSKPLLEMFGNSKNIFLCGPPGDGLATKLINNYCNFINYAVLCEAMNAGVRYGLNPKTLAEVMDVSSGMSFHTLKRNPVKGVHPSSPAETDFKPGFTTELAKGVLDMGVDLMKEVGAKQMFGTVMKDIYDRAITNDKCARQEHRCIYRMYSEDDGNDLGKVVIE